MVICLSTTVKNDTLQEAREQRVTLKCRKQLRVEELEMVNSLTKHLQRDEWCTLFLLGNIHIVGCNYKGFRSKGKNTKVRGVTVGLGVEGLVMAEAMGGSGQVIYQYTMGGSGHVCRMQDN